MLSRKHHLFKFELLRHKDDEALRRKGGDDSALCKYMLRRNHIGSVTPTIQGPGRCRTVPGESLGPARPNYASTSWCHPGPRIQPIASCSHEKQKSVSKVGVNIPTSGIRAEVREEGIIQLGGGPLREEQRLWYMWMSSEITTKLVDSDTSEGLKTVGSIEDYGSSGE
ncbi:hypothetical protein Tco_0589807 [Tanacetum coccineum]